jgi:DME family drug/metabolite transporter
VAAFQIFFFAGVARTGVAVGTIVALGTTPIAAGSLAILVQRQWPGRRWMVATALAIAGCALLILATGNIRTDMLGIFFAVIAGTAYAVFALFSKELLASFPVGSVLSITFLIGVMMLTPVLFFGDLTWLQEPRGLAVALHLGVVTVGFAYLLFATGLAAVPVATAATLNLAEPLTAGLLGVFLLGERLTLPSAIGIALLLAGLLFLALPGNLSETAPNSDYADKEGQLPHP